MKRLLPSYAMVAIPIIVMFLGGMSLIEINYHLSLSIRPEDPMHLLGLTFQAQSPGPWIISTLLFVSGFFFFLKARKRVKQSWYDVLQTIKEGGAA